MNAQTPFLTKVHDEYTKQICDYLTPAIFDGIFSLLKRSKEKCKNNSSKQVQLFFSMLRKIGSWPDTIIKKETDRIILVTGLGEFLRKLILAAITSKIQILSYNKNYKSIVNNLEEKFDLKVFIHQCYQYVSKVLYNNRLPLSQLKPIQFENIIQKCIEKVIRNAVPIEEILTNLDPLSPVNNTTITQLPKLGDINIPPPIPNSMKPSSLIDVTQFQKQIGGEEARLPSSEIANDLKPPTANSLVKEEEKQMMPFLKDNTLRDAVRNIVDTTEQKGGDNDKRKQISNDHHEKHRSSQYEKSSQYHNNQERQRSDDHRNVSEEEKHNSASESVVESNTRNRMYNKVLNQQEILKKGYISEQDSYYGGKSIIPQLVEVYDSSFGKIKK